MRWIVAFCLSTLILTATSAARPTLVVSLSGDSRLDVFTIRDGGSLERISHTKTPAKPGAMRFAQGGRVLYVGCSAPNTIAVFHADGTDLSHQQSVGVPGNPSFLEVTPSGRFLIASYYQSGQVTVHRIGEQGRLSESPLQTLKVDERAHGVAIDRSGEFVFVPHTRPNRITQLRFNRRSGELKFNAPPAVQRDPKVGPRHLSFHPTKNLAFGSNEQGLSLSAYELDPEQGLLEERQTLSSVPNTFSGKASTSHIEIHPSGHVVYIANRGHGTLASFSIDSDTGLLKPLETVPSQPVVRSFNISPDGRFLVAAGQRSGNLLSFGLDQDGRLTPLHTTEAGKEPWWVAFFPSNATENRGLALGQGAMSGEVDHQSVLLQTRLTQGTTLDSGGDLLGHGGIACFEWSKDPAFSDSVRTPLQEATANRDFIVREKLQALTPNTKYFYRVVFGESKDQLRNGPTCSFQTLPGEQLKEDVHFIVGSCMNYIKFMHGRAGNAGGPLTATPQDKQLGFPAFASMAKIEPRFFIGTGDIVYYDNPYRISETREELRQCWHEQFRFPRMIEFFRNVPTYWSKDDHDFRFNDSDNDTTRLPLPATGIDMFHEQLPIAANDEPAPRTFRTIRVSRDVQIWLTEGRDYRSDNHAKDGPEKTMWGKEQREWLKSTLRASDAKWKLVINPTPMVGPDDKSKKDNHASLGGFRHEADAFFDWAKRTKIENLFLFCGDRHWQYHSIHPRGIHEFACGALNDENARMGVAPGSKKGTDPDGKIRQLYTSPTPSGGFLQVEAGRKLKVTFFDDEGEKRYDVQFDESGQPLLQP